MPTTFAVTLTDTNDMNIVFHFAFSSNLIPMITRWKRCDDITFIEVIDETTGEIMYNKTHGNEYICSNWAYVEELH